MTRVSEERKGVQNFPTKRETQLIANKDIEQESRKDRESLELKTSESLNRIGQAKESLTEFDMVHQWKALDNPKKRKKKQAEEGKELLTLEEQLEMSTARLKAKRIKPSVPSDIPP